MPPSRGTTKHQNVRHACGLRPYGAQHAAPFWIVRPIPTMANEASEIGFLGATAGLPSSAPYLLFEHAFL